MVTFKIMAATGLLLLRAAVCAGVQREVPVLESEWWQIASNAPDVSPYNTTNHNACDFTIYQAINGSWHLVACIRSTSYPGATRLFHRWETSGSLTNTFWTPKGIFAVSQTNPPLRQYPGVMQAPHCFTNGGKYYMFYNGAYLNSSGNPQGNAAYCFISDDGLTFTNHTTDYATTATNYLFFTMGRDINLFSPSNGLWYACYAGKAGTTDAMVARSAPSLEGLWNTNEIPVRTVDNPESPFVVKRSGGYYLFQQMVAIYSEDPLNFNGSRTTKLTQGITHWKYAPEVFEYQGQWYIAGYRDGIWLAKMAWVIREVSEADLIVIGYRGLTFSSTQQLYSVSAFNPSDRLEVAPASLQASITASCGPWTASNSQMTAFELGYRTDVPLVIGANVLRIDVAAVNGEQKIYYVKAVRTGGAPSNHFLDVFAGIGGTVDFPVYSAQAAGSTATVTAVADRYYHFSSWTGSVTSSRNPLLLAMNTNKTIYAVFAEDLLTNGTPAWWLAQYGMETNDAAALFDTDGDSMQNWEEWIAGTVPTQFVSRLVISNPAFQFPDRVITWPAVSGRLYSVHWTTNLLNGFGSDLANDITGGGFTDAAHGAEQKGFYQIRVRMP